MTGMRLRGVRDNGYILRGVSEDGSRAGYYTGRAGDKWISENVAEAFCYVTRQGAGGKACEFNRATSLHGYWFIAVRRIEELE